MSLQLLSDITGKRWAMDKPVVTNLLSAIRGNHLADASGLVAGPMAAVGRTGAIAVLPIKGMIWPNASVFLDFFGGTSIVGFRDAFRQALADDSIAAIVLKIDSPGGAVDLVAAMADEIYAARDSGKPIVAFTETMAASAAYWLGSQATQFVATKYAEVGSIGVYCEHVDVSKALDQQGVAVSLIAAGEHKVDGNAYEPLPDPVRQQMQQKVDEINAQFVGAVARGRKVSTAIVDESFGQGLMFNGEQARKKGMIDRTDTFEGVIGKLSGQRRRSMAVDLDVPVIVVEALVEAPIVVASVEVPVVVIPEPVEPIQPTVEQPPAEDLDIAAMDMTLSILELERQ